MPRPRLNTQKAVLTGAIKNHPERFRDRSEPEANGPVGDPPKFFKGKELAAWRDFQKRCPWFSDLDEPFLVALCRARVEMEDMTATPSAALYGQYRYLLGEAGLTPASRSKVYVPKKEEEDNPFDGFRAKPN